MLTVKEMTDEILAAWIHSATTGDRLPGVVRHLLSGVGVGFDPGLSVGLPEHYGHGDSLASVVRPGCVVLEGYAPIADGVPNMIGWCRMVPNRQFYDRLNAVVAVHGYRWPRSEQIEVADLMQRLRHSLGLDDEDDSGPASNPVDDFYLDVDTGPEPDAAVVLSYLAKGIDEGICSPVGFTLWSDLYPDDPDYCVSIPAFFTMAPVCPKTVAPADRDSLRTRNMRFCDQYEDYLERFYYLKHPDQRAEIAELMLGLRNRLVSGV